MYPRAMCILTTTLQHVGTTTLLCVTACVKLHKGLCDVWHN